MHMNQKSLLRFFGSSADGVPPLRNTPARQTATTTATLTTAQIMGEVLDCQAGGGATRTLTTPTGTQLSSAFSGRINVGDSFDLHVINSSTSGNDLVIMAGGTGVTTIGDLDIEEMDAAANVSAGVFRFRNTAANTWDMMRIA